MRRARLLRLTALLAATLLPGQARADFTPDLSSVEVVANPPAELPSLPNSPQATAYLKVATEIGPLTSVNLGPSVGALTANLTPVSVGDGLSLSLGGNWFDPTGKSPVTAGIVNANANSADGFAVDSSNNAFLRLTPDATNPAVTSALATFSFATPVQAFGVYLTGLGTQLPSHFEMLLYQNGQTTNPTVVPLVGNQNLQGGVQFAGFTDPGVGYTGVSFQMTGFTTSSRDIVSFDGISFVTVVPEPSTGVLLTIGGLVLVGARSLGRPGRH